MEINKNGSKMLKVSSILLIIGGAISIVVGIISVAGVGAVHALLGEGDGLGILYAISGLALASGILSLIAGIIGMGAVKKPEKAGKCIVWGAIVAILTVVGQVLSLTSGNKFDLLSVVIGLLLPVVYILGANQVKKANNGQ